MEKFFHAFYKVSKQVDNNNNNNNNNSKVFVWAFKILNLM